MDDDHCNYKCEFCKKHFANRKLLWKHQHRKTTCVPHDKMITIFNELKTKDNKLNYFVHKTQKQEEQIQELRELINRLVDKESTVIESVKYELSNTKDAMVHEIFNTNDRILSEVLKVQNNLQDYKSLTACDFRKLIQLDKNKNNNQLVINKTNNNLGFSLNPSGCEKLDHITPEMWLSILDQDHFDDTMKQLTTAIYFHPRAPENMTWCVTDKYGDMGAIEYDFETGYLMKQSTHKTIDKNMSNVMFRVTDLIHELEKTCTFNQKQNSNSDRLTGLIGNPIDIALVHQIRDIAYARRNSPKVIWDFLQISGWAKPCSRVRMEMLEQ